MGVINSNSFSDGYTPICNSCGVCLCWDIGPTEYAERREFWDDWECRDCNPDADGSRKRYIEKRGSD